MNSSQVPWLDFLVRHIGETEVPGSQHNPTIVQWGRDAGIDWWNNDEDAWCAVAVNGALVNAGYASTRSALARSFTGYGTRLSAPARGAIVVFPRGSNPLFGHVGIVEHIHGDGTMTVVNGNVSNSVRRSTFRVSSVLPDGIRWPPGAALPEGADPAVATDWGQRALRLGSRGSDVEALQDYLRTLGYALGADGIFGAETAGAVRRFQLRRQLDVSGEGDPATLAALVRAIERRRERTARRRAGRQAAGPVAGAGAVAAAIAVLTVSAELMGSIGMSAGGAATAVALLAVSVAVVSGIAMWLYGLRRAEGDVAEDA